jgi:spore coat protein A
VLFRSLQLYVDDGSDDGITLDPSNNFYPTNPKGPDFLVIGVEGGFLSKPVKVASNQPFPPAAVAMPDVTTIGNRLLTGPAERWDVIVDFKGFEGKRIILYTDAPAPFPMGDDRNDFFPGNPNNAAQTNPGFGPNTRQILRFDVGTTVTAPKDAPLRIDEKTDLTKGIDPSLVRMWTTNPLPVPPGVKVRALTLNESFDDYGRLIQMEGTNVAVSPGNFGRAYMDKATEVIVRGRTEVWQIANLTGDTHPIHLHLVNFQILSRQPFSNSDPSNFNGTPNYSGPARGPEKTELGWKETAKMHPGEVTTIIARFDLANVPFFVPPSPRTGGNEFVWHCHILDHEEHDMMRPLIVQPHKPMECGPMGMMDSMAGQP